MTDTTRNYVTSEERDPLCQPGFRVRPDELSDEAALQAMYDAADSTCKAAVEARYGLLDLGFAADHEFCLDLDTVAEEFSWHREALREILNRITNERHQQ